MVKIPLQDRITPEFLITDVYKDPDDKWCYKLSILMRVKACDFDTIAEKVERYGLLET